jgi:hypothetical protein
VTFLAGPSDRYLHGARAALRLLDLPVQVTMDGLYHLRLLRGNPLQRQRDVGPTGANEAQFPLRVRMLREEEDGATGAGVVLGLLRLEVRDEQRPIPAALVDGGPFFLRVREMRYTA